MQRLRRRFQPHELAKQPAIPVAIHSSRAHCIPLAATATSRGTPRPQTSREASNISYLKRFFQSLNNVRVEPRERRG